MTISTNQTLRKFILKKENVTIINCTKKVFNSASVDASIVSYQNSDSHESSLNLMEYDGEFKEIAKTKTNFFLDDKWSIINFEMAKDKDSADLFKKISNNSMSISQIAEVRQGLIAYGVGGGKPPQTKKMLKDKVYHSRKKIDDSV